MEEPVNQAVAAVAGATALVVTAGAGMGVDSGLPDFRGPEGFWRAYPAYRTLALSFEELANPRWFTSDAELAWGFYGHRLNLYRATVPHDGFSVLRRWAAAMRDGAFVFTSNVDGQFQRAGFDVTRIHEVHGSIHHLQCLQGCAGIMDATRTSVDVDPVTFRARQPLPACPRCGGPVRPNVLMFSDWGWDDARSAAQEAEMQRWLDRVSHAANCRIVVIECGAGTGVPTVRSFGEQVMAATGGILIRINLREPHVPPRGIGIAAGARKTLHAIDGMLPASLRVPET